MVDMGTAQMTPVTPDPAAVDPFEVARVELVPLHRDYDTLAGSG